MVHTVEQIKKDPSHYKLCLNCGNRAVWHDVEECPECGSNNMLQYGEVLNQTILIDSLEDCKLDDLIVIK